MGKKLTYLILWLLLGLSTWRGAGFCGEAAAVLEESGDGEVPESLYLGVPREPDLLLVRRGFAVGYSNKYRQAVWVSYILSAENLALPQLKRGGKFQADPAVRRDPVHSGEYVRSGFDRGHLAPAADMTYSFETMRNSFYMTNISPQLPACNRGIWKRLETQVRRWAVREGELYVITGPIFDRKPVRMGRRGLPVPAAFYKVILDLSPPRKMIAFIIPNAGSRRRLPGFVTTVDAVEALTGCDFFANLDDEEEEALESVSEFSAWN